MLTVAARQFYQSPVQSAMQPAVHSSPVPSEASHIGLTEYSEWMLQSVMFLPCRCLSASPVCFVPPLCGTTRLEEMLRESLAVGHADLSEEA